MEKKSVAAYIRVSKDEAAGIHIEYFKKLLTNREDCELTDYYWDSCTSGRDRHRFALKQMITDAENGKFDYIIVKSLAKLSRDTLYAIELIRKLKGLGIGIYSVTERLDTLSLTCEKYLEIMEDIAEHEKQILANKKAMTNLITA